MGGAVPSKLPPPLGYKPPVAFQLCFPPHGLYVDVALWAIDVANDIFQATTFAAGGDYVFAILCGGASAFTFFMSFRDGCSNPFVIAKESIRKGYILPALNDMLWFESALEAPMTGLVAPYGMSLRHDMTMVQAVSSSMGLVLSAFSMAKGQLTEDCNERKYAVTAIIPKTINLLAAWRALGFLAELAAFTVAARVLHPILTVPLFALGVVAAVVSETGGGGQEKSLVGLAMVVSISVNMTGPHARVLGLEGGIARGVGWMEVMASMVRLTTWASLCLCLDLPNGLGSWATLNRPMGKPVMQSEFLQPTLALANISKECLMFSEHTCNFAGVENATLFKAFVFLCAVVLVPIHMLITTAQLLLNKNFRNGEVDADLTALVDKKQQEIEDWSQQLLEEYGAVPQSQ